MTDEAANETDIDLEVAADTEGTSAIADDSGADRGDGTDAKKDSSWPSSATARLGEVVSERNSARDGERLAREKAEWLQDQLNQRGEAPVEQAPAEVDTVDLYNKLKDAVDEGRGEDVANIQRKINAADRASMEAMMESRLKDSGQQVAKQVTDEQAESEFQRELKQTLADHPEFNDNKPEYDAALAGRVMRLMRGFHASGTNKVDAMREAIEVAGVTKKASFGDVDRGAGERTKNAKQSREQAPDMTTIGNRAHVESTVDVKDMNRKRFEEFKKDDAAYKKARGDVA